MKIYISGKISGLPINDARLNFSICESNFSRIGYKVVNPMSKKYWWNRIFKLPWIVYMIFDILLLLQCRGIFFQRNWKDSRGSRIERNFAKIFRVKAMNDSYMDFDRDIRYTLIGGKEFFNQLNGILNKLNNGH